MYTRTFIQQHSEISRSHFLISRVRGVKQAIIYISEHPKAYLWPCLKDIRHLNFALTPVSSKTSLSAASLIFSPEKQN